MNQRRNWKKVLALVLALLMLPAALSGCGRRKSSRGNHLDVPRRSSGRSGSMVVETQPPATQPTVSPTVSALETQPEVTTQQEPLLYYDSRIPNYTAADPRWQTLRYDWSCQDGLHTAWFELTLDANMYTYYHSLGRYQGVENYYKYINDENNAKIIRNIVEVLRKVAQDLNYDDAAVAREIAKFVQDCITYAYDDVSTGEVEFPRYPLETLYERQGDCEDTSILMAALLKGWGYEVGFLHLPGHVAVALRTADDYNNSAYYEIDGHRYLYIESTGSGWNIGDIPEDYQTTQAEFYLIP